MHRPRRRFSQNFLIDPDFIGRIVRAVGPRQGDRIVEIGPGLGALTGPLLDRAGSVDAIEIDRDAVRLLRERFGDRSLHVYQADALEFDLRSLGSNLRIVGNLPYHISTPLLFHVDEAWESIRDCHFMLQKEVVDRMAARPNTPEYGRLSVMIQRRWSIHPLFAVPPSAFKPEPKVWSSVARLTPAQPVPVEDDAIFRQIVSAAFSKRRKTLRNALRGLVKVEDLQACGVEPGARGETLAVSDFARIANRVRASSE